MIGVWSWCEACTISEFSAIIAFASAGIATGWPGLQLWRVCSKYSSQISGHPASGQRNSANKLWPLVQYIQYWPWMAHNDGPKHTDKDCPCMYGHSMATIGVSSSYRSRFLQHWWPNALPTKGLSLLRGVQRVSYSMK